jgi:hypothetical protein
MRFDVGRLCTVLVVLLTIVTLASLGVETALKMAIEDLRIQASPGRIEDAPPARSLVGRQLSAALASDIAPANAPSLDARALELDHRADRLLEGTAVIALVGMLLALLSGRPAIEFAQPRAESTLLANTSSNGSVRLLTTETDR